jgi:malate permease and related proteins
MTYPFLLKLSFGELIPTGYVIYFSWLPQTPLSIITLFPPTLALLLGLALRFWVYPEVLTRQLQTLSGMLTPLVMTAVGFQLTIRLNASVIYPLGFGLAIKMAIAPIIALVGCHMLGLNGLSTDIAIFEAGMPPAVTSGAIAIAAGMMPELAAALVSLGLALAFVTLPILYLIL